MTFRNPRLMKFVVLAILLATGNTFGSTLAATLFLAKVGTDELPVYFILFAVLSIPLSLSFARLVDRVQRLPLFLWTLAGGVMVSAILTGLAGSEHEWAFFAIYLGISLLELMAYSLYFVLLSDFFTTLEVNRFTARIAMAMGGGGLLGGALVWIGSLVTSPTVLIHGMSLLLLFAWGQAFWIGRSETLVGEAATPGDEGLLENLRNFPKVVARHPIVALISASVFFNILLQCIVEYQVFSIYTAQFPDEQQLGAFLGVMNAAVNSIGVLISGGFTGPMIRRLGVPRMNLVYPGITLASLVALAADFRIPAAIFGHVAYDAVAHSVDAPVFTANYNAVPRRFVGRVRVLNDGLTYPLALAVSGGLLLFTQDHLTPLQLSLIGIGISLLFVICGTGIGRLYTSGMLGMLRDGSLTLEREGAGIFDDTTAVPRDQLPEIRAMLSSAQSRTQRLAVELLARGDLGLLLSDMEELLPVINEEARAALIEQLHNRLDPTLTGLLNRMFKTGNEEIRALTLEVLVSGNAAPPRETLLVLAETDIPAVAAIAALALARNTSEEARMEQILATAQPRLKLSVARCLRLRGDRQGLRWLDRLADDEDPAVAAETLRAATTIAGGGDRRVADRRARDTRFAEAQLDGGRAQSGRLTVWGRKGVLRPEPMVRIAACQLLGVVGTTEAIERLAGCLGDAEPTVRIAAVMALSSHGRSAVAIAAPLVRSDRAELAAAAIEVVAAAAGNQAEAEVMPHLRDTAHAWIERNLQWRRSLPDGPETAALRLALADSDRRAVDIALHALAALSYRPTVSLVRTALATGDTRARANAIEALLSVGHRRMLLPLLPILDPAGSDPGARLDPAAVLAEALKADDRWIRLGAIETCRPMDVKVPIALRDDPDELVRAAARKSTHGNIMSRLIFLKSVPLFEGLSLDDLLSVDMAMGEEQFLPGEAVIRQGETGDKLYVLLRGTASIRVATATGDREVSRLQPGDYFGEMAMFDYAPRSASVVALEDCTLLTLRRDRFRSLVVQRPDVLMHICKMFGDRVRVMNQQLSSLQTLSK